MQETKLHCITKKTILTAYGRAKANKEMCGFDEPSIEDFEKNLNSNLYKI